MKKILFLIFAIATISACKKQLNQNGPELCPTGDFSADSVQFLGGEDGIIDITSEGLNITAEFGNKVIYSVTIKSATSIKTYNGSSKKMNIHWYGNSDNLPIFSPGEIEVTVDITCLDKIVKNFELQGTPKFKDTDGHFGVLIRDWDQNGAAAVGNQDTANFADGYFYNALQIESFIYTDSFPSPMGGKALQIDGLITGGNKGWFFGANELPGMGFIFDALSTYNADSLYYNIYVKGDRFPNTNAELVLLGTGGPYVYTQQVTWDGWQMISVPLSSFKAGGNPLISTEDLTGLAFQLGAATEPDDQLQIYYDFAIITVGEPFFKR